MGKQSKSVQKGEISNLLEKGRSTEEVPAAEALSKNPRVSPTVQRQQDVMSRGNPGTPIPIPIIPHGIVPPFSSIPIHMRGILPNEETYHRFLQTLQDYHPLALAGFLTSITQCPPTACPSPTNLQAEPGASTVEGQENTSKEIIVEGRIDVTAHESVPTMVTGKVEVTLGQGVDHTAVETGVRRESESVVDKVTEHISTSEMLGPCEQTVQGANRISEREC